MRMPLSAHTFSLASVFSVSYIFDIKLDLFVYVYGSDGKACSAGDLGSIPGLGRSPGEGNGNPLQYSCLENSMD